MAQSEPTNHYYRSRWVRSGTVRSFPPNIEPASDLPNGEHGVLTQNNSTPTQSATANAGASPALSSCLNRRTERSAQSLPIYLDRLHDDGPGYVGQPRNDRAMPEEDVAVQERRQWQGTLQSRVPVMPVTQPTLSPTQRSQIERWIDDQNGPPTTPLTSPAPHPQPELLTSTRLGESVGIQGHGRLRLEPPSMLSEGTGRECNGVSAVTSEVEADRRRDSF